MIIVQLLAIDVCVDALSAVFVISCCVYSSITTPAHSTSSRSPTSVPTSSLYKTSPQTLSANKADSCVREYLLNPLHRRQVLLTLLLHRGILKQLIKTALFCSWFIVICMTGAVSFYDNCFVVNSS